MPTIPVTNRLSTRLAARKNTPSAINEHRAEEHIWYNFFFRKCQINSSKKWCFCYEIETNSNQNQCSYNRIYEYLWSSWNISKDILAMNSDKVKTKADGAKQSVQTPVQIEASARNSEEMMKNSTILCQAEKSNL